MKLYRFVPFDRSGRIAWMLRELNRDFEVVELDARNGEHRKEAFCALSPAGKVPLLIDGDVVLFESGAALQYLAETYGEGRFAPPPGGSERAQFLSWMYFASASLDPVCFEFVRPDIPEKLKPARRERARFEVTRQLDALERQLGEKSTILASGFSIVDIQIAGPLHYADVAGCLEQRVRLQRYLEAMRNRPAAREVRAFGP